MGSKRVSFVERSSLSLIGGSTVITIHAGYIQNEGCQILHNSVSELASLANYYNSVVVRRCVCVGLTQTLPFVFVSILIRG